ncbi:putative oxidoreductase [compost metagenome]
MTTSSLQGKVAVVTGGALGLGRQITAQLLEQGARVAILGRTAETLQRAADELGENLLPVVADVADPQQVRQAFSTIVAAFGGVDILVNNAAIYRAFGLDEASDEELQTTFVVNVLGPTYCIREAIPLMRQCGGGDIVNVSSESARAPFPMLAAYAASKGALETLSAGLRNELRADGIRVTVFRSGHMNGDNTSVLSWPEGRLQRFLEAIELSGHGRFVGAGMAPQTVARALVSAITLPREANVDFFEVRPA